MAKGLNKVILIGKIWPRDPELSYTPNGTAVCKFTLSTDESYKGDDGNWVNKNEYHNIVAWRKLGEICAQYLKKESKIYVEGKIQTETYEKDGKKNYFTKIVINEMIMLDNKPGSGSYEASVSATNGEKENVSDKNTEEDLPF